MNKLLPTPLTSERFKTYGNVIETKGVQPVSINQGNCQRFSNLADLDFDQTGVSGISLFVANPYSNPYQLSYVERHPLGSQAFLPMTSDPFLVLVANDLNGKPDKPEAFVTNGKQGVNYGRGVWHGVLTPIGLTSQPGQPSQAVHAQQFAVVDYIGAENNLEEYIFDKPYLVEF